MTEKEKQILNIFAEIIPKLTGAEKEKMLNWGEGMAFLIGRREQDQKPA